MRVLTENEESHLSLTSCKLSHLHSAFRHLRQQSSRFTIAERDETIRDPFQRSNVAAELEMAAIGPHTLYPQGLYRSTISCSSINNSKN